MMSVNQPTGLPGLSEPSNLLAGLFAEDKFKETVPAKLFQTEAILGFLLRFRQPAGEEPQYKIVLSNVVSTPQILQRTTMEVMLQALKRSSSCRAFGFPNALARVRLVCSDRYAAQLAAERVLTQERGAGWVRLYIACEIHKSTASQAKGLLFLDSAIGGAIRLALSLRLGGWMRVFRQCLFLEVVETIDIQFGRCTDGARRYRAACLWTFLGAGRRRRRLQSILECLPNGDWRLADRVQVFLPPDTDFSREKVAGVVARALLATLTRTSFLVFNRGRWTKNDTCINQLGLLQCCHGLLTRVYKRWLLAVGYTGSLDIGKHRQRGSHILSLPSSLLHEAECIEDIMPDQSLEQPGLPLCDDDDDPIRPAAVNDPKGEHSFHANAGDAKTSKDEDYAKRNARTRVAGLKWLNGDAHAELILIRLVMEPSMNVLRQQLYVGSKAWERQQSLAALRPSDGPLSRDYRILVSARGDQDEEFLRLHKLLCETNRMWITMPKHCLTEFWRCLAFRCAAREAAEYHRLLTYPHRRPPFLLFLILVNPSVAERLKRLPRCLLDSFTKWFMETFDISSSDARAFLMLLISLGHTETSKVECWHAWARRFLVRRGTQTHRPNFLDLSSSVLSHRCRCRREEWQLFSKTEQPAKAPTGSSDSKRLRGHQAKEQPVKKRRGGGGAWRAFVSRNFRDGRMDIAELAKEYNMRSAAEVEADRQAGSLASHRHRLGHRSFEPRERTVQALANRNVAIATIRRLPSGDDDSFFLPPDAVPSATLREHTDVATKHFLAVLAATEAVEQRSRASKARQENAVLASFTKEIGHAQVASLVAAVPKLHSRISTLHALPLTMPQNGLKLSAFEHVPDAPTFPTICASLLARSGDMKGFLGALDEYWSLRHLPILQCDSGQQSAGGKKKQPAQESRCFDAGVCLCGKTGLLISDFRNMILRALKNFSPKGSFTRKLLLNGMVVLRLCGRPRVSIFGEDDELAAVEEENIWWHVPLLMLKPYFPVVLRMTCRELEEETPITDFQEVSLEALLTGSI